MFNLATEHGNTLDLADCVQNSLETESPFISFYSQKQDYHVSYYLDDKSLSTDYYRQRPEEKRMLFSSRNSSRTEQQTLCVSGI